MVERAISLDGTCTGQLSVPSHNQLHGYSDADPLPLFERRRTWGRNREEGKWLRIEIIFQTRKLIPLLALQMYLRSELGDGTLAVMMTLKNALDPNGIMNPGKVGLVEFAVTGPVDFSPTWPL